MKILFRIFFIASLFLLFVRNISAQDKIVTLEFHQSKRDPIYFPCRSTQNCIDTVFQQQDTLCIYLQETRKFYRGKVECRQGLGYC